MREFSGSIDGLHLQKRKRSLGERFELLLAAFHMEMSGFEEPLWAMQGINQR